MEFSITDKTVMLDVSKDGDRKTTSLCAKCIGHLNGCPDEDNDITFCDDFREYEDSVGLKC